MLDITNKNLVFFQVLSTGYNQVIKVQPRYTGYNLDIQDTTWVYCIQPGYTGYHLDIQDTT